MYGRWKKTNSPPPSKASRATEDTLELPTLGRKKSKSEPRIKADWELEIELKKRQKTLKSEKKAKGIKPKEEVKKASEVSEPLQDNIQEEVKKNPDPIEWNPRVV